MNGIWQVLGIAPTKDKRAIRAAYSAMAKQCHPEEDPQGFRMLHEAYQEALAYAAGGAGQMDGMGRNPGDACREKTENIHRGESLELQPDSGKVEDIHRGESAEVQPGSEKTEDIHRGESLELQPDSKKVENIHREKTLELQPGNERTENIYREESAELQPGSEKTENIHHKEPSEPHPEGGETKTPSLLARLDKSKEDELSESMRSGALFQFSAILNDPKKFRKADAWKAFFLSEAFLREQYRESFADGMLRILEGFHTGDNYSITQMPSGFLQELAIAYALVFNSRQSEERAANFYAREVAASIWNMQQTQYSLPLGPLSKPENEVRRRSFADYIRLRDYNSRGLLTPKKQEDWKEFLQGGVVNHLYELAGKGRHEIYPGSRSVCLLDLCAFWIRQGDVPACVLEFIYKAYGLRGSERTSTRRTYEPLKQAILSQYPDIEEALFGEDGKAKMISDWYKDMMRIISDNERFYEESGEIRERVQALFAREEWKKIRYLPELFKKLELQLFGRSVMPASLAKRMMEYFSDETGIKEQVWDREVADVMTEEMLHSIYYSRIIRDMHGNVPEVTPYFEGGKLREVYRAGEEGTTEDTEEAYRAGDGERAVFCTDFYAGYPEVLYNQDFWHYFLMRGFGCRGARFAGRGKYRREYMAGTNVSLPAYMKYLYEPSMRWQKLFVKGEKKSPMPGFCQIFTNEDGDAVPGVEFLLPDGKSFRAEFYLHYVRYFLDGREVFQPAYCFAQYMEFAKSISNAGELVFLLAITKVSAEESEEAQAFAGRLLAELPLAPVSIPVIAKLLVAGVEDEAAGGKNPAGSYSHHRSLEMAAESPRYAENRQEEKTINFFLDAADPEGNRLCGVFYVEDGELCFRAVVREGGFSIFRQTDFGWEELYTAAFEGEESGDGLLPEDKIRMAQEFLRGMKRPAPRRRVAFCLKELTNEKKAEMILQALKRDARYRGSVHGLLPYAAGYPWDEKDTGRRRRPAPGENIVREEACQEEGETAERAENSKLERAAEEETRDISGEEPSEAGNMEIPAENALQRFYREYGGFLPECYCVLRFGENDTQVKKDHVFYASMKPFGFSLAFRALDWPSSYEYREKELRRKVKEKYWAVGHFGWGDLYGPEGEGLPRIVSVGESGTYYYYDVIRMMRQENLAALLARMFDFSNVVAVENYEGELSISRFSGELEYCYGREAFLQSAYTKGKTAADLFTVFTKAEMMGEFAVYMDGLLGEVANEPESLYFDFSYVGDGAYEMRVFVQDVCPQGQELGGSGEDGVMLDCQAPENFAQEREPLVWKIWPQGVSGAELSRDFKDTVYWYMECGKFGKKLAGWEKVTAGFDLGGGNELVVYLGYGEKEGMEWYRSRFSGEAMDWEGEDEDEEFGEEDFEGEEWE